MSKMMLHDDAARRALARGVAKLTRAVSGTLGPRGMNAVMDRPVGTPIISRDGVSIADEIELECPFENMGAQIVREVARQTNEVAGDGTTTATVLADVLVQQGLKAVASGANPVELVQGMEQAVAKTIEILKKSAVPVQGPEQRKSVATIAANNDEALGAIVAEAFERAGPTGIVDVQYGIGVDTVLDVHEGMSFDRGYLSHHMVTDVEKMRAVLDNAYILMTDLKIHSPEQLSHIYRLIEKSKRPLLIMAEELGPECIVEMMKRRETYDHLIAAIHPPEFGHWRKAVLEDIAIVTGGKVIARDLGGTLENCKLSDLGSARQIRISAGETYLTGGEGKPEEIQARREQVQIQYDAAPENIERDKFVERLAKLSGGTALILAGGATPVEQKRRVQIIEDAINATRAAILEGVVAGGGVALLRASPGLSELIEGLDGSAREGAELVQGALSRPLAKIAANCGLNAKQQVAQVTKSKNGTGLDARTGKHVDLIKAGVIDPVQVCYTALQNAGSVAGLILTTQTLVAKKPDDYDPTAGPALGGGAELLGMD